MPIRKIIFENFTPYHVVNRGVERRPLFLNEEDYLRFIFQLFAVNRGITTHNLRLWHVLEGARAILSGATLPPWLTKEKHPPLVSIVSFVVLPDAIHLVVSQSIEGGLQRFMQKLSTGYAMYFNAKYERIGSLFQGRFRAIPLHDQEDVKMVRRFINAKPLDIYRPDWKARPADLSLEKAQEFIEGYRWSGAQDLRGRASHLAPEQRIERACLGNCGDEGEWLNLYLADHTARPEFYRKLEI